MGRIYDATWGRGFSALYDRLFEASEDAGLREMRRQALAPARGRTLDLGAGTGANLELYPDTVSELVLAEPDPHMIKQLRKKASESNRSGARLVEAGAESLPFDSASFNTVAVTLVLCTVPDPEASVAEIARILKPGGSLLFLEHVRSSDPGRARWQDRLERPWHFVGDGCHCNRDTVAILEAADGLDVQSLNEGELPKAPPIVRPLVRGAAVAP